VQGFHKLDALTRILEAEPFDAMLIFVRTKLATVDLSEKLEARGYASAPLNGDIAQNQRERTVDRLKNGKLDIVVATDVAARGLDVTRISHVVNYDIPADTEAYVHRIGRTGRAGREGDAILFVTPREKRMLYAIENATRKKIDIMDLPSTDIINNKRIDKFKQRITETMDSVDLSLFSRMIEQYQHEHDVPPLQIAAALAQLLQGDSPFLLQSIPHQVTNRGWDKEDKPRRDSKHRGDGFKKEGAYSDRRKRDAVSGRRPSQESRKDGGPGQRGNDGPPSEGMERYRLAVGHDHGVMPGNIVGAIANEADITGKSIGRINIYDDYTLIDLPAGMPNDTFNALKKIWVAGQKLGITRLGDKEGFSEPAKHSSPKGKQKLSLPKGKTHKKRDEKPKKKPKSRRP